MWSHTDPLTDLYAAARYVSSRAGLLTNLSLISPRHVHVLLWYRIDHIEGPLGVAFAQDNNNI